MKTLDIHAPAKVNLCLHVVGKRDDGYHLLDMIMLPLAFGDTLRVSVGKDALAQAHQFESAGIALQIHNAGAIEIDERNLCYRAAELMRRAASREQECIHIELIKRVPAGGGLGGGSSDAAAVLRALNRLWDLHWTAKRLTDLGVQLGADVPFFCYDGPARVQGIGEKIEEFQRFPECHLLLANPGIHVETAGVFRRLDFQLTTHKPGAIPRELQQFEDLSSLLANDLEAAVCTQHPEIAELKQRMLELGAAGALMSGSGASVFALFVNSADCERAAQRLRDENVAFVVATRVLC